MTAKNLLIELGVEELPPQSLEQLGFSFAESIIASLQAQALINDVQAAAFKVYASPRRLAVWVPNVVSQAADKPVSRKLMPVKVGLDEKGRPTPPLLKKLTSLGASADAVAELKRVRDGKTETLFLDTVVTGTKLADGVQIALDEIIGRLPIPKVMTYQLADGWESVNFVRPAHTLVALHGSEIIPVRLLGLDAGREALGHRFEASQLFIQLQNADSYAQQLLEEGAVIAGFDDRRNEISQQLNAASEKAGLTLFQDDALLNEVTALVEWPNVLIGQFDPEFLEVPQECLILTMKANQKYFPLMDANAKLANKFLLVSNIRPADPSLVVTGNERVVRSRLADAKFFYDQDRKKSLESRLPGLDQVVYHNKLGTQGERIQRVRVIARSIALLLGGEALADDAGKATLLSKTDLLTEMVGEFPELQGIMGYYYALHDGHGETIAQAIADHYKPRFSGDSLPRNMVGICVALADKLETLTGLFSIGQVPTGDKDPFALRRHALGVIRILIEKELPLSLDFLLKEARLAFDEKYPETAISPLQFIYDRLAGNLREQGYTPQTIDAVLSQAPAILKDIPKRLEAVRAFEKLPEAPSLAAANKRVHNILEKSTESNAVIHSQVNTGLLKEPAETALYDALMQAKPQADNAFESGEYTRSLQSLAALKEPVDTFFDHVMVNTDDAGLRINRLCLLKMMHQAMNRVADLSKLAG
ncbi:glycyl-tRNA synthetase beta chain [Nitrosomonas marina]|uniref:Glycine--tRNA ligase beta subunit n=1 Tax=Nitrosomonas marina TaxID=917 RepID=A0A1I0AHW4_9PROT|nr:glycine--tRNA ligase subunit beta [Nitrosomonas marina]SES93283.1 glycyl-tRNA synthetase beta chain [Nitrosomonas marina]